MMDDVFTALNLSPEEGKTWLTLLETGPCPAGEIAKRMGAVRPSVYGYLKRLADAGVVTQSLKDGVKLFVAERPEVVKNILNNKITSLQDQTAQFEKLIPALTATIPMDILNPRFEFFEGAEGVKNVLRDMLLYSGIETRSYWPMQAMVDILGSEFFHAHNKNRIRNRTSVKAIWPQDQVIKVKDHPYLGSGKDYLREIRVAPPEIDFSMGYWIYKNKVAFLSSRRESFGFIIESQELAEMMTSQHELVWKQSKKLAINAGDMEPFLRELRRDES